MERERLPDREGYLDYCRHVAAGDRELEERADRQSRVETPTVLGQYHRMAFLERAIEFYHNDRMSDVVERYEIAEGVDRLQNRDARKRAVSSMLEKAERWNDERLKDYMNLVDLYKADNFTAAARQRMADHPGETEGQAWFAVKLEVEAEYYERQLVRNRALGRELYAGASRAWVKDQEPQLGDPGYAEWRDQQHGKDRDGRER